MVKKGLSWRLPRGFELAMIVLVVICFILMDEAQNKYQPSGVGDSGDFGARTLFGMSAVGGFFLFFLLYNAGLFVIFSRSLRQQRTSYRFDLVAGIVAFVGLLFILGAGIGALYFSAEEGLPYFLGISQITVYHFGIFLQWLALLYFVLTD